MIKLKPINLTNRIVTVPVTFPNSLIITGAITNLQTLWSWTTTSQSVGDGTTEGRSSPVSITNTILPQVPGNPTLIFGF